MKEIKIQVPEGYEGIDEQASNFAEGKIVFKKKEETPWRRTKHVITGYYIENNSKITDVTRMTNCNNQNSEDRNVFATKKQAKSTLAMAYISQIMANDERFGGPITDEEWINPRINKYVILRKGNDIDTDYWATYYHFLAFHTKAQRKLFLQENEDLIRQYFMLD